MFFISITFIKQKRRQSVTIYFVDILYKNCKKFYVEQSYFILKLILSNATVHYTNNKSNEKKNTVTLGNIHSRRTVSTSYMIQYRNHK